MLLTISTSHTPATDLGYLLHKHPGKVQEFEVSGGVARVFYPAAGEGSCEAALLLEIDPVGLVRGRGDNALDQYVNDRPYVASSFMSVAIATVFKSALNGVCKDREGLVKTAIPLVAKVASLPCRGGEEVLRRLFEPLGYRLELREAPLDSEIFPGEGSGVFAVTLSRTCTLSDLLTHLYVLLPVLDGEKHYYVGAEEVEKLLRFGAGEKYVAAYRRYCWPVKAVDDLRLAPFHVMATEGRVHTDKDHLWHMSTLARLARTGDSVFVATNHREVNLLSDESQGAARRGGWR